MKGNANPTLLVPRSRTLIATDHHILCLMSTQGHLHLNSEKDNLEYNYINAIQIHKKVFLVQYHKVRTIRP